MFHIQWFHRRPQQQNKSTEARLLCCKLLLHLYEQDTSLRFSFLMYVHIYLPVRIMAALG